MTEVTLRPLRAGTSEDVRDAVRALRVAATQQSLVASVEKSLAQVAEDPALTAYAAYDGAQRGLDVPPERPVGFAVTEVRGGVGFILRVLIDEAEQGRGYGRALMLELVRRLRLQPEAEIVATSHRPDNPVMARLCASLGFEAWPTPWEAVDGEVFLAIPRR